MAEEVFPEFHEVSGLLKSEVQFLCHQQEIVVINDVSRLLLQSAKELGTDCYHATILAKHESTVGSETHTNGFP